MKKIYITIEDGMLTGVYTDGEPVEVELIDYDNINAGEDQTPANELEAAIHAGKLANYF